MKFVCEICKSALDDDMGCLKVKKKTFFKDASNNSLWNAFCNAYICDYCVENMREYIYSKTDYIKFEK